jgi:hypothetical protein
MSKSSSPKPYFDTIKVRSALLRLIEAKGEEGFCDEQTRVKAESLYSFYRNPAPVGMRYLVNEAWVESDKFKSLSSRLEELLLTKIPKARSTKTLDKYSAEAIDVAIALWEGLYVIEKAISGGYIILTQSNE